MTRVKISISILSVMIIVSIFTGIWINKRCDRLITLTEEITSSYNIGNTDDAKASAEELEKHWTEFRKTANLMVKNDKLSEIERICFRILPLIEKDSDEVSAELEELSGMLIALRKGEEPVLTSVF